MQDLVQQLQRAMELNLDPTWRLLDRMARVIRTPALHEAKAKDAEPSKVVHSHCSRHRETCTIEGRSERLKRREQSKALTNGWGDPSHAGRTWHVARNGSCLSCSCSLGSCCLLLHLSVTLTQVKDLDVGARVDFVHGVAWRSSSLTVQVIALDKDAVVTQASNPHITFTFQVQADAFTYVQPAIQECE